jgi:hypothetical protein
MRRCVSSRTTFAPLNTRETVATETLACRATSLIVTIPIRLDEGPFNHGTGLPEKM